MKVLRIWNGYWKSCVIARWVLMYIKVVSYYSMIELLHLHFIVHFTMFSKNIYFFANLLSSLNSIRYRSNRFLIIWSSNSIFAKVSFQSNLSVQYVLVCNFVYVITPDIYSFYASLKLLSHVLCVCQFAINFFYSFFAT